MTKRCPWEDLSLSSGLHKQGFSCSLLSPCTPCPITKGSRHNPGLLQWAQTACSLFCPHVTICKTMMAKSSLSIHPFCPLPHFPWPPKNRLPNLTLLCNLVWHHAINSTCNCHGHGHASECVSRKGLCASLENLCLAPALGLAEVEELLSIGEAAYTDLINSTRIKLLCHKGLSVCGGRVQRWGGRGDGGSCRKTS